MKAYRKFLVVGLAATILWGGRVSVTQALPDNTIGSKPVTFNQQHNGWKISENIYMPKNYQQGKKYPAIITVHPGVASRNKLPDFTR